jgi:hypothetical protein
MQRGLELDREHGWLECFFGNTPAKNRNRASWGGKFFIAT